MIQRRFRRLERVTGGHAGLGCGALGCVVFCSVIGVSALGALRRPLR